jgi:Flp pilus assembly protein TadD
MRRRYMVFPIFRASLATFSSTIAIMIVCSGCTVSEGIKEKHYRKALELIDRGTVQLRARSYPEARASFSMAYELAPLAAAVDGLGCVSLMEGRYDDAEQLFTRAFEMDASYDEAIGNLALLNDIRGNKERARELYEWLVRRRPDAPFLRNNLAAVTYDLSGDKVSISKELRKAEALGGHGVIMDNITRMSH